MVGSSGRNFNLGSIKSAIGAIHQLGFAFVVKAKNGTVAKD